MHAKLVIYQDTQSHEIHPKTIQSKARLHSITSLSCDIII